MSLALKWLPVLVAVLALGVPSAVAGPGKVAPPKAAAHAKQTIGYTELLQTIDANEVTSARIAGDSNRTRIEIVRRDGSKAVSSYLPSDTLVQQHLVAHRVRVTVAGPPAAIWGYLLPPLFVVGFLGLMLGVALLMRRRGIGPRRPGQPSAAARMYTSTITFTHVAGCDEAIDEVREMVDFLREPERFARVGARIPSSVLLYGPPGTGKTLIAKALAGEAGVSFFAASGSEFIEMYVGVGAKRIRELFARARRCENGAVVFLDEIDAIGRHRSSGAASGGNDEREQTLNQLLVELDGFDTSSKVVVVAATNRIDILDKALDRKST